MKSINFTKTEEKALKEYCEINKISYNEVCRKALCQFLGIEFVSNKKKYLKSGEITKENLKDFCEVVEECWNWKGAVNNYGKKRYKGRSLGVHRISYLLNYGYLPDDRFVCHKCDNPLCVNPAHLFLGTPKVNNDDRVNKK